MSLAGVKVESDTVSGQECHVMSRGELSDHVTMLHHLTLQHFIVSGQFLL